MPVPDKRQQRNKCQGDEPERMVDTARCQEWPDSTHVFGLIMQQLKASHQQQVALMGEHIERSAQQLDGLILQQKAFFDDFALAEAARRKSRLSTYDDPRKARLSTFDGPRKARLSTFDDPAVSRPKTTPSTGLQRHSVQRSSRQSDCIQVTSPSAPLGQKGVKVESVDASLASTPPSRTSLARSVRVEAVDIDEEQTEHAPAQSLGAVVKRAKFTCGPKAATQDLDAVVHMSSWERKKRQAKKHARQVKELADDEACNMSGGPDLRALRWLIGLRLRLQTSVSSALFEGLCGALVMANAVFVGLQVEYAVTNPSSPEPYAFKAFSTFFAISFALELSLKLIAFGHQFFLDAKQRAWNCLDTVVVVCSLGELLMEAEDRPPQFRNFGVIRTARILKVMRLARMVKVFQFSHDLRVLLIAIGCSLRFLVWAMMLLSTIIYMFGVLFSQATADYLIDGGGDDILCADFMEFYGSLPKTCRTLFESVSGGVSWHEPLMCIEVVGWQWEICFLLYISFAFLAVLNVVTGVFCNSAIEAAQLDQDMVVQLHKAEKENKIKRFKELFNRMDEDGSGTVTLAEFEQHLEDSEFASFLSQMDLAPEDAWDIFRLLDTEGRYEVNIAEFVEGCLSLRGTAKTFDIKIMMTENKYMIDRVRRLIGLMESCLLEKDDVLGLDVHSSILQNYLSAPAE